MSRDATPSSDGFFYQRLYFCHIILEKIIKKDNNEIKLIYEQLCSLNQKNDTNCSQKIFGNFLALKKGVDSTGTTCGKKKLKNLFLQSRRHCRWIPNI